MLTVHQAIIGTLIAAGVTFFTRVFPFAFFDGKSLPQLLVFIQKYIPPMTMMILVVYSVKDVQWEHINATVPTIAGILLTALLHLWKNNALISITAGTAIYMYLIRVL